MKRPSRRPLRRLAQISLAAIIGIVGLPVLSSGGNVANAVESIQCKTEGNVFVSITNSPAFRLRKQQTPADGYNQWSSDSHIGNGWDFRFISGPNGYLWFTLDNGELRRHQWIEGAGWANNGISELITTGWGGWNLPQFRYRITVDSNNTIYTVDDSGSLKQHKYNETTKQMSTKVIEGGWGKYDQVFAAGNGVLWARDPAAHSGQGVLYRFVYDDATGTFKQHAREWGWGWNGYKQLTSPGGDIVYGTFPGGETWWYRWNPARDAPQNNAGGNEKQKISTWGDVNEIAPAIDTCKTSDYSPDVVCKPGANMWGVTSDGGLFQRSYQEAATGITSWTLGARIGNGWNGLRMMAGADGYKYYIRPDGEVHRHRWIDGVGWDNNGISKRIATGWTGWDDPRFFNRITVDSNNHFYSVGHTGQLEFSIYNDAANTWTQQIIDDGWGRFDQVFAAGDGVLYARDPNIQDGTLYRFHYDWKNRRWIDYARNVGWGWKGYTQILSPGGDVIIGRAGQDVFWYRFDNTKKEFTNSGEGSWKEYIAWWQDLQGLMMDVDSCKLTNPETITPPQTPAPSVDKPEMIYNPQKSRFEIAYSDENGTLRNLYQQVSNSELLAVNALSSTGFTGRATIAQREDNKIVVQARGTNAQVKSFTEPTSVIQWTQKDVNGALSSSPTLVRGTNKVLTSFAVDDKNKLWYSEQFGINGEFKPWRKAVADHDYNMTGDMTVVASGDGFEIAYVNPTGTVAVKRFVNGELKPQRVAAGIKGAGAPAAVVFADGKVQLVARDADNNKLYTQKEGASGFTGWTDISGALTFTGTPEALLNKFNVVEIVARDSSGSIHRGGQTAPGSTTWRVWADTLITSPFDVSFAASNTNEQRIFAIDGNGNYYLIDSPPYSSDQSQAMPANADKSVELSSKDAPSTATKQRIG